jgi:hypothetical protein
MTVRDLIVKLTETGELNREVVFGRVFKTEEDGERRRIVKVEVLYPVERIFLGDDENGPFLAVLE